MRHCHSSWGRLKGNMGGKEMVTRCYQYPQSGAKWLLRVNNSPLLAVKHWHHFEGAGMDFKDIFLGSW